MRQKLKFHKMQSLGNDFMVVEAITKEISFKTAQIKAWANRSKGVGFDQLLVIEPPTDPEVDFRYRIFNADGSEAEQCGNGSRCVALLVNRLGLSCKDTLQWQTTQGQMKTVLDLSTREVIVETYLQRPSIEWKEIPFNKCDGRGEAEIDLNSGSLSIFPISIGNPHAVIFVNNISKQDVSAIGKEVSHHSKFANKTNVEFCQIINDQEIALRVYERGVGETAACGSGAAAAFAASKILGQVTNRVKVKMPGGELSLAWEEPDSDLKVIGPATFVYSGEI